eukprot:CAMPEP_0197243746 /NCGR_PEP_ID=MMETSP1429-20130617/9095_1 /TAXON_ID=49237 /ORGANISM="Chaetoceros  sp., Strain UNC1202" /LENGTH=230 /DNA_ID=CAMNT_0042704011 /DNA_START=72 /DNA_END=764 /DNA_ORIENTATION=+
MTFLSQKKEAPSISTLKCTLCPHAGGAMSISKGGKGDDVTRWTHEICRIWCSRNKKAIDKTNTLKYSRAAQKDPVCCICGMGSVHNRGYESEETLQVDHDQDGADRVPGLIKCAAANCDVTFHPMCAVLSTKLRSDVGSPESEAASSSNANNKDDDDQFKGQKKRDADLCKQYSLDILDVRRTDGDGNEETYSLPVVFCGLHNQNRDASFYGCLPCVEPRISGLMRIPYQ